MKEIPSSPIIHLLVPVVLVTVGEKRFDTLPHQEEGLGGVIQYDPRVTYSEL